MRIRAVITAAALGVELMGSLAPAAVAGGEGPTQVRPSRSPQGERPQVLHEQREVIHDGDRAVRVRVPRDQRTGDTRLLGRTTRGYVVGSSRQLDPDHWRFDLWRVRPGHATQRIRSFSTDAVGDYTLDAQGKRIAIAIDRRGFSGLLVLRVPSGKVVARRPMAGQLTLEHFGRRLLVSRLEPERTVWFAPGTGAVDRVAAKRSVWLGRGLVTREERRTNPEGYPCLRVVRLSAPDEPVWRSCTWSPWALAPDGRHVVVGKNADAPSTGPTRLQVQRLDGGAVVRELRVPARGDAGFSTVLWEDRSHLLMVTQDLKRAAVMRCSLAGTCERATRKARITSMPGERLRVSFPGAS
jgi:hypothetical protein